MNKFFSWYFSLKALPFWAVLALDCLMVLGCGFLGSYFELGAAQFAQRFWPVTHGLMACLVVYVAFFRMFHTYSGVVRFSTFVDLQRVGLSNLCATLVLLAVSCLFKDSFGSIRLPGIFGVLFLFVSATLAMLSVRMLAKRMYDVLKVSVNSVPVYIYGVQAGGVALAKSIQGMTQSRYRLSGFVSPDGAMTSYYLMGHKVVDGTSGLAQQMRHDGVQALLVSPLQINRFRQRQALISELIEAGIHILFLPDIEEWDGQSDLALHPIREVEAEDLLPRDEIEVNVQEIGAQLRGRRILISGAAGSIGSEMVRQVARFEPSELVLVDQAETPMHDLQLCLAAQFPTVPVRLVVASMTDEALMEQLFAAHRPEYVFHAAAYKHVPMMEDNPASAIRNNIRGTRVLADLAVKYGTSKFVMISTDKAVNPTSVMGCSKRICEIYCQSLSLAIHGTASDARKLLQADGSPAVTQFVTTRFGNVLGSNGSVIPLFREQIRRGGPLTVTHPDVIRYFMLIPEACKLVLEAGTMGHGGEIFVFDMGQPVRIVDLARRMLALAGARDVAIRFTGLRQGEKLYEEVLADREQVIPTQHPKIHVARVRQYDYDKACAREDALYEASFTADDRTLVGMMADMVPEYHSTNERYRQPAEA